MPFSALSCRSNSFCFLSFAYRPNKLQASHAHRSKPVGPLALYRPYPAALMLKHFHDIRLVRQSQVQSMDHGVRHFGELEYRLYRILFCSAGEPNRQCSVFASGTQKLAGNSHVDRFCGLHSVLFPRATYSRSKRRLCPDRPWCGLSIPRSILMASRLGSSGRALSSDAPLLPLYLT
jgi:hypothetical protein